MRAATKSILIVAILTGVRAAPALGQVTPLPEHAGAVQLSIVVPSIVRVVTLAGDPANGGLPQVRVVSNDPRFRALAATPVRPEATTSQELAYEPAGHGRGGAAALAAEVIAGPTTYRYTVALP